ncbi:hypothetical protein [Azospirillum soli]|uniref:hypothetical protein n=1 Tax=Azospirillum soli TaxID=1304799 RepID=UPI001AE4DA6E|nr:hypothetical protein [Azospirillum soli]MBP2312954.1 hypothetical protein [Azospirillum soli]
MLNTTAASQRETLAALDLSWLEPQLMRRHGFDAARAARAVRHYRCFLEIAADHPERPVAPPAGADKAWHVHMLYNERYNEFCRTVFGTILHHDPEAFGTPAFAQAWEFTRAQFAERMNVALPGLDGAAPSDADLRAEQCWLAERSSAAVTDPDLQAEQCWVVARDVRH